jgi:hypothetical protein
VELARQKHTGSLLICSNRLGREGMVLDAFMIEDGDGE